MAFLSLFPTKRGKDETIHWSSHITIDINVYAHYQAHYTLVQQTTFIDWESVVMKIWKKQPMQF